MSEVEKEIEKEIEALRQRLKAMSDDEIKSYAVTQGVDISQAKSRADIEAAIELDQEAKMKAAAADAAKADEDRKKASRKKFRRGKGELGAGPELNAEQIATVQKVWAGFAINIPYKAMSQGRFELDEDELQTAVDHEIPDGVYRVSGADWLLTFDQGRFVEAAKASPQTDPASSRSVPSSEV
jgi:hypothetical protein